MKKFTLVSMPYACISRREMLSPALPVGTLKAFLNSHGWNVDAVHAHLRFLYDLMEYEERHFVFDNFRIPDVHTYGLDILFMSLAEGTVETEKSMQRLLELMYDSGTYRQRLPYTIFQEKVILLRRFLSQFIEKVVSQLDIDRCQYFGMSCVHGQMFAAVELSKRIHAHRPDAKIIFGGIDCHGETGRLLLQRYPFIDCVVTDEGELPLLRWLEAGGVNEHIPGLAYRDDHSNIIIIPPDQPYPIEELPAPDYADFFAIVKDTDLPEVTLPVFTSRGCPWKRCTFCNIPGDRYFKYRAKSAGKFADEIIHYTQLYPQTLEFVLTDNDIAVSEEFYQQFAQKIAGRDLLFSGHAHATRLSKPMVEAMRAAGFYGVEVGVEALSESLLRKINKGSQVVDNLKALKLLRETGIDSWSNIIPHYPTETLEEVEETLRVIEKAKHLFYGSHLTLSNFMLYPRCDIWKHADEWGIQDIRLRASEYLTGYDVSEGSWFTLHEYQRNDAVTAKLWTTIEYALSNYEQVFHPCFYRRAGECVVIYDFRDAGQLHVTNIDGVAKEIFLACATEPLTKTALLSLCGASDETGISIIERLVSQDLLFESHERYLALPTRIYLAVEKFFAEQIAVDSGLAADSFNEIARTDDLQHTRQHALIVIDVQQAFMNKYTEHLPGLIHDYVLQHGADYSGIFFTYFKNQPNTLFATWHGSLECMGAPDTDIPHPLSELSTDANTFAKSTFSACCIPELMDLLKTLGIRDLDIAGLDIDACILITAMQAFDMGFRPHILTSLCASSSGSEACRQGLEILARHVDIDMVLT